ncbi:GNAT family N-acetyltransferase [Legionella cardiaca]|uniref:GNAT family N-acetyltransferase n=1 Tax=Legionella cardiaca TaxID=1071983 RepID=A0ABY8ATG0_9GAMM|nr:GNAT family N-acetyltransferase [Legionella cardiaca]WED43066.1 GNAT family N-acetyltransferase [Legionella cardiaca]
MEPYFIETKHLGLRLITREDVVHLEKIEQDPVVKKYYPEGTLSYREIKDYIEECLYSYERKHLPCLVIFKLQTKEFIGEAYFDEIDHGEVKVGYLFHKRYWNKGYATEVLSALLAWAKENIATDYIVAYADIDNKASIRVMKKCGMEYYKDGIYLDMKCKFYRIKNR